MRIGFATIVTLVVAIPLLAFAGETPRLTDAQYLRASRCAALAQLPQIKGEAGGMEWLAGEVKAQGKGRVEFIRQKATDEARAIARSAKRAESEAQIAALKEKREEACAGFERMQAKL